MVEPIYYGRTHLFWWSQSVVKHNELYSRGGCPIAELGSSCTKKLVLPKLANYRLVIFILHLVLYSEETSTSYSIFNVGSALYSSHFVNTVLTFNTAILPEMAPLTHFGFLLAIIRVICGGSLVHSLLLIKISQPIPILFNNENIY